MRRTLTLSALVLAGALALPATTYAQANPSTDDRSVATAGDRDNDHGNWGWLGIFGLAGLLGLKRNDRVKQADHVRTRQPV